MSFDWCLFVRAIAKVRRRECVCAYNFQKMTAAELTGDLTELIFIGNDNDDDDKAKWKVYP